MNLFLFVMIQPQPIALLLSQTLVVVSTSQNQFIITVVILILARWMSRIHQCYWPIKPQKVKKAQRRQQMYLQNSEYDAGCDWPQLLQRTWLVSQHRREWRVAFVLAIQQLRWSDDGVFLPEFVKRVWMSLWVPQHEENE